MPARRSSSALGLLVVITAVGACGGADPGAVDARGALDAGGDAAIDAAGQGAACTTPAACASGSCVDGVCCDRACAGACEACAAGLTGGVDGTCAPAAPGATCGAYVCDGASAVCPATCVAHADCAPGHACADGACVVAKRVFVTSTLAGAGGDLGGLTGADATCARLAAAAGLPGTFKAWLSDSTASAAARLTHHAGPYYRVDAGEVLVVADDWADLTNGLNVYSISDDEHGTPASAGVWTGTQVDGSAATATCRDWTSRSTMDVGMRGVSSAADTDWTAYGDGVCDVTTWRFYCFEQ